MAKLILIIVILFKSDSDSLVDLGSIGKTIKILLDFIVKGNKKRFLVYF